MADDDALATLDADRELDRRARRADEVVEHVDANDGRDLFGLARRSGLDDDEADDAVQEALLRLWLEVRSGVEIIEPRAWAFRTTYRLAMDQHRLRRQARDVIARLSSRQRPGLDADAIERGSIWRLIDRLPTRQRQVLYLRYKADLSYDQIAAVMSITASGARAHAAFAFGRLRETIGPEWRP